MNTFRTKALAIIRKFSISQLRSASDDRILRSPLWGVNACIDSILFMSALLEIGVLMNEHGQDIGSTARIDQLTELLRKSSPSEQITVEEFLSDLERSI